MSAKSKKSQNVIWLWGLGWNETARSFKSISSPWTWVALPWANGSRTSRRCQTRRRTATIKANHCKLWVRSSGQQTIYWAEASTLNQPFANTAVPCPIIEQPYEPELRVFTSHDRAPSQASNISRAKWCGSMQNLRKCWKNCNLQFLVNYTKYYTFRNYRYKSLIYKGFWGAWLSVNP